MTRTRLAGVCLVVALFAGACGGSSTSPSGGALSVAAITPNTGSTFGGTTVTITGSHFTTGASVTIGGVTATNVTVTSDTAMTATTGVHASGTADVVVSDGGQKATIGKGFTYVSPGSAPNSPPTILGVTAQGSRANEPGKFADLGESITLTASVQDAETPASQLTYQWSSSAGGTFSGTGPSQQWQAPLALSTPLTITLTVTVVERYNDADASGLPIPKENRVTSSVDVSVHDSNKEVGDMSRQFLLDFSDSSIKDANFIMRNFTSTCPEALDETSQVANNRVHFRITSYTVGPAAVTTNFRGTCPFRSRRGDACAQVPVDWASIYLDDGSRQEVRGTDQVTALYLTNESRWRLCGSDFDGFAVARLTHEFIRGARIGPLPVLPIPVLPDIK